MQYIKYSIQDLNNKNHYLINKKTYAFSIYIFFVFFLLLFPAFRPIGIDRDSANYASDIIRIINEQHFTLVSLNKEPLFYLIVFISKYLFSNPVRGTLVIFAAFNVILKTYAIFKYSKKLFISLIVYLALFYILQEFNTIRSGASAAVFLFAYNDIKERKFFPFMIKVAVATLFHYSSIFLIIFYLLNNSWVRKNINKILIIAIIFDMANINFLILKTFSHFAPSFISYKLNIYINMLQSGLFSKVSNERFIFNIGILLYIIIIKYAKKTRKLLKNNYDIYLLTNYFELLLIIFFFTKSIPVIASRTSETASIYLLFLIPQIICAFKKYDRLIISIIIILFCSLLFIAYIKAYYPII